MRSVVKGAPDPALEARRLQHLAEIAAGTAQNQVWKQFNARAATRSLCMHEQFGLCAYSEVKLDAADLGMHLDHVQPRSTARHLTFDHANLLLSAIDDIGKRKLAKADVFGGHARGNRYSAAGFIRPLMADCRRYFQYSNTGDIEPHVSLNASEFRRARYSIQVMNLNAPILVNRRRIALELLEDEVDKLLNNPLALERFAQEQLCPGNGLLPAFHSGARERFGTLADTVTGTHCPACA